MYVKTYITLEDLNGKEDDYEVGACVDYEPGGNGWAPCHTVGEPDFSAPGGELSTSRLASDPQSGDTFPKGWSDRVEEALIEAHEGRISDLYDSEVNGRADYEYDRMQDEEYDHE